jgi:hypothetical protein
VFSRLRKPNARIKHYSITVDAGGDRCRQNSGEFIDNFPHYILVDGTGYHGRRRPAHVHQDNRATMCRHHVPRIRIVSQTGYIIDDGSAALQGGRHRRGIPGVYRNTHAMPGQPTYHR